jgi:phage terminase small subunit
LAAQQDRSRSWVADRATREWLAGRSAPNAVDGAAMSGLSPKQARFVEEYICDLNATQAAIRAGYSQHTAYSIGYDLLRNPEVEAAIAEAQTKRGEKAEFTAFDVFKRWATIATADPNELVQHRRAPCRYCNGKDRAYQWKTPREFAEAEAAASAAEEQAPSDAGGYGYSVNDPIDPNCPECGGDGIGYTVAADTRTLSPRARVLYAGVRQTKDGLEIKMHDQQKALENVARHLGMFADKLTIEGRLTLEQLVLGAISKEEAEKENHQPWRLETGRAVI